MSQLFNFSVSGQSYQLLNELKKIGLDVPIKQELKSIMTNVIDFGLHAAQSKVPVDSAELRNKDIRASYPSGNNLIGSVFVTEAAHYGKKRYPTSASLLAEWLNEVGGRRTQTSIFIPPFGPVTFGTSTAGWILEAQSDFLNKINSYIRAI